MSTPCPSLTPAPSSLITGPVVCVIMDGVGIGRGNAGDAVARAHTPYLDGYGAEHLTTQLAAHGIAVGMPSDADMGNSEVGHNAIGAGRVYSQGAKCVAEAIASGDLFRGEGWRSLLGDLKASGGALHLVGLLSDGNVHSHIDHVLALLRRADAEGVASAFVHTLLDGRDVRRTSALEYVNKLEACLADISCKPNRKYRIASGGGRMQTTMDRYESDWSIVERGWKAHVLGEARGFASATEAVETFRAESPGIGDQELPPFVVTEGSEPVGTMQDGDAVIAFNFRGDRMLQLCAAFERESFSGFDRVRRPQVQFAAITLYDGDTQTPKRALVSPPKILCTLGELLCEAGIGQLACSETQKFGHVTYFWNGNRSGYFDEKLERYIEVPSHLPPFDAKPEMRAAEIVDATLEQLANERYRFARINLANGDMVGHTGNFDATVAAVEAVDREVGRLAEKVVAAGGALVVTADHGNADDMAEFDKKTKQPLLDAGGRIVPKTSHSLNPVPLHVVLPPAVVGQYQLTAVDAPGLGNIATTCATLLGFEAPQEFLPSLIRGPQARPAPDLELTTS